ncbi:hypothetical protein ACROYT_G028268 [Oculina patagonica]
MSNLTEDENHISTQAFFCTNGLYGIRLHIFLTALNICLSVTAFLWNVLILIALQKESSFRIHPPSKLLFRCLVSSDLCVGLILQPIYVTYLMSLQTSYICRYVTMLTSIASGIFCGVSLVTLTAISVDRLLALQLGLRYKQIVTLKRVRIFVIFLWLASGATAAMFTFNYYITVGIICIVLFLCLIISTFCYTKIYITLRQHQSQVCNNIPRRGQSNGGGGIPLNISRYRKTVSAALCLQMILVACYFPFCIVAALYAITGVLSPSRDFAWEITLSLVMFNSSLTPVLYFWKIREMRQAVRDTLKQLCCLSS